MVQVNFGNFKEYDVNNRFFNPNLAGGALLDIEVYNFPRADHATVTYTSDGHTDQITCGESSLALNYEIRDMEEYVTNLSGEQNLEYIHDVRDVLTQVQKVWGKYE